MPKTAKIDRPTLRRKEAEALTEDYRSGSHALWAKLLTLYEGKAHKAMEYDSWGEYAWKELDVDDSHAYRLLNAAKVKRALGILQMETRGIREAHTRNLDPLLRESTEALEKVARELLADGARDWSAVTAEEACLAANRWLVPRCMSGLEARRRQRSAEKRLADVITGVAEATSRLTPDDARHLTSEQSEKLIADLELLLSALRAGYENREGGKIAA